MDHGDCSASARATIALFDTTATVAVRRAQHDPAADPRRHQCAGRPPRHLVRADGLADEPGAGGGALQTKYLNLLFEVDRGSYADLAALTVAAVTIGFIVPVAGILAFGKRAT